MQSLEGDDFGMEGLFLKLALGEGGVPEEVLSISRSMTTTTLSSEANWLKAISRWSSRGCQGLRIAEAHGICLARAGFGHSMSRL